MRLTRLAPICAAALLALPFCTLANELRNAIETDYEDHLADLFVHFHQNPELSTKETETAKRLGQRNPVSWFRRARGGGRYRYRCPDGKRRRPARHDASRYGRAASAGAIWPRIRIDR